MQLPRTHSIRVNTNTRCRGAFVQKSQAMRALVIRWPPFRLVPVDSTRRASDNPHRRRVVSGGGKACRRNRSKDFQFKCRRRSQATLHSLRKVNDGRVPALSTSHRLPDKKCQTSAKRPFDAMGRQNERSDGSPAGRDAAGNAAHAV